MSDAVRCCLCDSLLTRQGDRREILTSHLRQEHKVVTKDKTVLQNLLLMHNEHQILDFKTRTRNNSQSQLEKENLPARSVSHEESEEETENIDTTEHPVRAPEQRRKSLFLKSLRLERQDGASEEGLDESPSKRLRLECGELEKSDRERTIEKMRLLQKGKSNGTYVQCSLKRCRKWRYLDGCEDPSSLPDTWQCRLHPDPLLRSCQAGTSEKYVENSEEFVSTQYVCGSMVWAKMKGFPWWPGLVDICPDTDEYYWLAAWDNFNNKKANDDKKTKTEPTWYNVVFFDFPQVKRAWIKVGDILKLEDVDKPPKVTTRLRPCLRRKWKKILAMADDCHRLDREERLEKFSFAALFDGKWGYYDEYSNFQKGKKKLSLENAKPNPTDGKQTPDQKTNWKPSDLLNLWTSKTGAGGGVGKTFDEWQCDICSKLFPYDENIVTRHLLFHHMSIQDYLDKYDQSENRTSNLSLINWSQKKKISQLFQDDSKRTSVPAKIYDRPCLDAESLIALSVKFLDPGNNCGATFQEMLAFLTIIFPYYGANIEECQKMILEVYNCQPDHMTNTRARLKPELLEKLSSRMEKQLTRHSGQIERALLAPQLLERFRLEGMRSLKSRKYPECSEFLLVMFSLLVLKRPVSVDQISVFLSVLFPALQPHIVSLKKTISDTLQGKEFFEEQVGNTKLYRLNSIEHSKSLKLLEDFIKMPHNLRELKEAAFDADMLDFYLKSINNK